MVLRVCQIWRLLLLLAIAILLWITPADSISLADDLAAPAVVEPLPTPPITNRSGLDPNNIPAEKVNQFVHACLKVVALIERREGELQGSETESESARIEQEIEAEALAIIEQAGLTRQEYLQLLGLANTDPEFGERIAIQLQEATS